MTQRLLICGGGIAGLAAALAARRAGWQAAVHEQAAAFTEVGAGVQLGPNVTRILHAWEIGQSPALRPFSPERLRVRDARDGRELASMALRGDFEARYGSPYITVHRADLHEALRHAAQASGAHCQLGCRIEDFSPVARGVKARTEAGLELEADALALADGVWSRLRQSLLGSGPASPSGHLAYRALVPMDQIPAGLRTQDVTAWLGTRMHLVSYPVRAGEALNIVCVVHAPAELAQDWDLAAQVQVLRARIGAAAAPMLSLIDAVPAWRAWALFDREPVAGPHELARGRVAVLGDAAHPMRPYLAQGAGMSIEDAFELGRALSACDARQVEVATALRRYALNRWQRVAAVQRRSRRNGRIFHATGLLRLGRNLALRLGGQRVLDLPWLYR